MAFFQQNTELDGKMSKIHRILTLFYSALLNMVMETHNQASS